MSNVSYFGKELNRLYALKTPLFFMAHVHLTLNQNKLTWPSFANYLQKHEIPCKLYEIKGQFDDERNIWIQPNNLVFLFAGNPIPYLYRVSYHRKLFRTYYVHVPMTLKSIGETLE